MAISGISIDTFFSALNSWDASIAEGSKWYAVHIEQDAETQDAIESSLVD